MRMGGTVTRSEELMPQGKNAVAAGAPADKGEGPLPDHSERGLPEGGFEEGRQPIRFGLRRRHLEM